MGLAPRRGLDHEPDSHEYQFAQGALRLLSVAPDSAAILLTRIAFSELVLLLTKRNELMRKIEIGLLKSPYSAERIRFARIHLLNKTQK